MNKNIKDQLLEEYKLKRHLYDGYSLLVKNLLEGFLRERKLKFQIERRIKNIEKLAEKIDKKQKEGEQYKSLNDIEDLAGVRIILYIESDKKDVIQFLYQEFEKCITKSEEKYKPKGYQATHLIFRLDRGRAKLSEYNQYTNLNCELQIITILFHAWSEVEHDIIYKPKGQKNLLESLGLDSIRQRFEKLMAKHIQEATIELDLINKEYKSITRMGKILARGFLNNIRESKSNDEIFEKLKLFEEFYHKKPDETFKMISWIINKSPQPPELLHRFDDADLYGKSQSDLVKESIELLDKIRYLKVKEVFSLLIKLSNSGDQDIKSQAIKVIENLAKYNFFALKEKGFGFVAQVIVLNEIEKWNQKKLIQNIEALLVITREFLDPSFDGVSWKADKMTFHSGPISVNDNLRRIRQRTIKILKKSYSAVVDVQNKKQIIQTLQSATHLPGDYYKFKEQKYVDAMKQMIKEDSEAVIDWYIEIASKAENQLLLAIEEIAFGIRRSSANTIKNIDTLYKALGKNKEYQIYRALVGYDYKLYDYRLKDDLDREASERKKKTQEFVQDMKECNLKIWAKRLSGIVDEFKEETDRSLYYNLMHFLVEVGRQKPSIAIKLLGAKVLDQFYPYLLRGILQSKLSKQAKQFILDWIDKGEHLEEVAGIFLIEGIKVDVSILNKLFEKAKATKDSQALMIIARVAAYQYSPKNKDLEKLFVAVIKELNKFEDVYRWASSVWYIRNDQLKTFFVKEADLILGSFIKVPNIDYHFEEMLAPIAEAYPKKIIEFFRQRVDIGTKRKETGLIDRYNAVPYNFHILGKILREHERIVVTELMKWYRTKGKEPWRFRWDASHLIKNIFPNFSPFFEKAIIAHIRSSRNPDIVFDILQAQKGESYLWNIVCEIVKKYHTGKKGKEIQRTLFTYLSQMGVVMGEYGFFGGYKEKKKQLEKLSEGENDKYVKQFINEYGEYLDKQIVYYKKQADEEVALRKRGIFQ